MKCYKHLGNTDVLLKWVICMHTFHFSRIIDSIIYCLLCVQYFFTEHKIPFLCTMHSDKGRQNK